MTSWHTGSCIAALLCAFAGPAAWAAGTSLQDPTRPLVAPARKSAAATSAAPTPAPTPRLPRLQMVLVSDQQRIALIDDELVAEGDVVKGLQVLSIRKEAVILATPRGPRTLPLSSDIE